MKQRLSGKRRAYATTMKIIAVEVGVAVDGGHDGGAGAIFDYLCTE